MVNLCQVCFSQVCEDGKFNGKELCERIRENMPKYLSTITSILEENKKAF